MSRDVMKMSIAQWTTLFESLHGAPQNDALDQIALEISMCVDLNISNDSINESTMVSRAKNKQKILDERSRNELSKLDLSFLSEKTHSL